jgi:hypothetical protein
MYDQLCLRSTLGLAEPAAVIFVALVLPVDLSPKLVEQMLAGVGGIMCVLSRSDYLHIAQRDAP